MDTMAEELLELGELPERPIIKLFGEAYGLISPQERSMEDNWRHASFARQQAEFSVDTTTPEDVARMAANLKQVVYGLLPDAPPDVIDRLTDGQRLAILQVWNKRFFSPAGSPSGKQPAGKTSQRGSNASTAARTRGRG